jgi:hypothetical protein
LPLFSNHVKGFLHKTYNDLCGDALEKDDKLQERAFLAALRGDLHCSVRESKRAENWTQYSRKIEEKDGTICAFPCGV